MTPRRMLLALEWYKPVMESIFLSIKHLISYVHVFDYQKNAHWIMPRLHSLYTIDGPILEAIYMDIYIYSTINLEMDS
jgi:hypothetical protein